MSRATASAAPGWTMAALTALPLEDCASMMQSRKRCLALSAQALSPLQPQPPRKPENDGIKCAMLSVAIWKQRAMPPTVGDAPTTDARLKKRIGRPLVHEVVADIDDAASEIVLIVHWVGGAHSELRLSKRRGGQRNSTSADIIQAVRQLVLITSDDLIPCLLNRNSLTTGNGNRWTRERVTSLSSDHHIPV